jgi:hypothetical protein
MAQSLFSAIAKQQYAHRQREWQHGGQQLAPFHEGSDQVDHQKREAQLELLARPMASTLSLNVAINFR